LAAKVVLPKVLFHTIFKLLEMLLERQSSLYSGYNYRIETEELQVQCNMDICGG
jgi:hypothetical protein